VVRFNKLEQALIERFTASGRNLRHETLNTAFRFMVRQLTTVGVDTGNLTNWFEDEAFPMVTAQEFDSKIRMLMVSPTIMDGSIAKIPSDHLKFRAGERTVSVGINIDYLSWSSASSRDKIELLSDNIVSSVNKIPAKYLSAEDREKLLGIIHQVRSRLELRLLH
jgi:hypothetical protein